MQPDRNEDIISSKQKEVAVQSEEAESKPEIDISVKKALLKKMMNKPLVKQSKHKDLKSMVKRPRNQLDHVNKTVNKLPLAAAGTESPNPAGLRRSKRIKLDSVYEPVYKYEEAQDFEGNLLQVQTVAGYIDKKYPNKYVELMTSNTLHLLLL